MTTVPVPVPAAKALALAAIATYKRRYEGFPEVSDDKLAEAREIYERRRLGAMPASEKQQRDALALLQEQNARAGFKKLLERARSIAEFLDWSGEAQEAGVSTPAVTLSYDDWFFLAKASDVQEADLR